MKKSILLLVTLVLSSTFTMTAFAAPKDMGNGEIFDAEYYANTYADIKAAFGTDETALYNHYIQFGKAEGRQPYATTVSPLSATQATNNVEFNAKFYADTYPDLKAAFGYDEQALYNHYIQSGKAEGRIAVPATTVQVAPKVNIPDASFDAKFYADTYPDLKAAFGYDEQALYNHYIQSGKAEGRICSTSSKGIKTTSNNNINTQLRADQIVYITRYGAKYHYDKECASTSKTFEVSLEKAKKTHQPCKTCVLQ